VTHISDFAQLTLQTGPVATGPVATGTVTPDGTVDWIHVWIVQSQESTLATATGFGSSPNTDWSVQTHLQEGSVSFQKGTALALGSASITTIAENGTRDSTVLHWSQSLPIE
jgi:hypothetical protein